MTARPLIPSVGASMVTVGEWLDRQVQLLADAHQQRDPVALKVLRGTGVANDWQFDGPGGGLPLETARLTMARDHGFADWTEATAHAGDRLDARFEAAADAIQWGELDSLRDVLDACPELIGMRSPFVHRATLLHHVAANGIEVERQLQSPTNAAQIARLLLERGAEPDAVCDTYGGGRTQTTLYLLVSSCVPAAAGVQGALVQELCRGGALSNGPDDNGEPLWTAIAFGYTEAAEALVRCGARVDNLVFAAALGDLDVVQSYFDADGVLELNRARLVGPAGLPLDPDRVLEYALIWASSHNRSDVVAFLLGKEPDLTFREPLFHSTALGVARHMGNRELVALLEPLTPGQSR